MLSLLAVSKRDMKDLLDLVLKLLWWSAAGRLLRSCPHLRGPRSSSSRAEQSRGHPGPVLRHDWLLGCARLATPAKRCADLSEGPLVTCTEAYRVLGILPGSWPFLLAKEASTE